MSTFSTSLEVHHLESRKQSTLLIHYNVDLKKALHQALATSRVQRLKSDTYSSKDYLNLAPSVHMAESWETLFKSLKSTLPNLNSRLKIQSKKITEYYKHNPLSVVNFNYEDILKCLIPLFLIWSAT